MGSRFIVGLLLILANILFWIFKLNYCFNIGEIVNFNSAILLVYSFIAFIMYGSIAQLTEGISSTAVVWLRKNDIHIWEEH